MPLSKEFYLEEIKSKYPNSYNESLKDLPVKDLEDMLDFLESALDKADGGPVGIEVLFTEKVPAAPSQLVSESDILLGYRGDAAYRSGSAQASSIGQGNVGSKASFGGGKGRDRSGRDEGAGGADRSKVTQEQNINQLKNQLGIKDPNLIQKTFNTYNQLPFAVKGAINTMAPVELMKLFNMGNVINTGVNQMKNPDVTVEDVTLGIDNLRADLTKAQKKALGKQKMGYDMGLFTIDDVRENIKPLGDPDKPATNEEIKEFFQAKDGGRVGLFMGGPALEGQALAIYNSMNAYGFTDQEIANALAERGLYTPGGSTPDTPDQGIINQQLQTGGGRDDNKTGFGKFGNLDPTTERTFVKDVYTIDKNMYPGAPMTGSFKPTEVTGYKNVNTGAYQTLEGKNINHAGINVKPAFVAVLEALGLGDSKNLTELPYKEGQIAGTFTGKKLSDFNPLNLFRRQQTTIGTQNAATAEAIRKAEAAEKLKRLAAEEARLKKAQAPSGGTFDGGQAAYTGPGGLGGGQFTDSMGNVDYQDPYDPGGGEKDGGIIGYKKGGLATMFRNKR